MRGNIPWEEPRSNRYTITEWEIEGRATALLLVDLQRAHVDPEVGAGPALNAGFPHLASYYYERLHHTALPATVELQSFFRKHDLPVIHALSGLALPGGKELAPTSWRAVQASQKQVGIPHWCSPEAPERRPWPQLAPTANELVFFKETLSPFNGTPLDPCLRNMGVENLLVSGVLTNAAVETTARDASDRGFNTILVDDACAALSAEEDEAARMFATWYIARSSSEIMSQLGGLV